MTPFVDGELPAADRRLVEAHLHACSSCHSRVVAERAVHELIRSRCATLSAAGAPDTLHAACGDLARSTLAEGRVTAPSQVAAPPPTWRSHLGAYALAASLVVGVGAAFVYQATASSVHVLAAELTADHVKCFAMNSALGTRQMPAAVERSMASVFDWPVHLPENPAREGLELVGARPCLYGEGKLAHIMYRHNGKPVSLFMLPKSERAARLVKVLGHEAAVWCVGNRTFVLVAREPRREVERMVSFVRASLR